MLAAIGEQFAECMAENDDICGVTVTLKEREDVIQVIIQKYIMLFSCNEGVNYTRTFVPLFLSDMEYECCRGIECYCYG